MGKIPSPETERIINAAALIPQENLGQTFGAIAGLFPIPDCVTGGAITVRPVGWAPPVPWG